jgi:tetratricopeptide (TPR) repeat protein
MQERIRRTLHGWLDSETAKQPVIVVLEDLHWGDAPSISILTEALRERANRPTMVLGLARPDAERQFPDFAEHAALRIRLQGLTPRAAEQLMAAALHSSKDAALVARVVRTADGNPFYLEELIRRVAAGGTDWPDTVLAMAQSRIEELDSSARCALRAASVFGERAWDAGVQEMLGPELDAASLLAVLARRELLVPSAESRYAGAKEYRFRHALLRDAAYAMMTDRDRRASHGVASKWLESNGEKDGRILAGHFEAAGLDEQARPWLVRAAKAAVDAGDIAGTIDLANRGVKMGASGVERGGLLLARAYAEAQRGEPNLEVTREALELLPVGTAKWWLALGTLIYGSGIQGRPEEAAPYVSLAQQAPFASEMDAPFGQGLVTLVGGLVLLGKPGVAELIVDRVGQAATGAEPDPIFDAFLCSARSALISVAPVGDKWRLEEAYFGGKRAIHSLRQLGAAHGESVALYYFATAAIHLGRYEEAREACQRSVELAQYMGCSINDGWPHLIWARALLRLGQPDEALETVSTLSSSQNRIVQHMLPVAVAEARFRQGNFASAEAEAAPACSGLAPRLRRLAACILAHAQLAQGRPQEALLTVQTGLEGDTSQGLETDIDLLTLRAEAFYATGQQREAAHAIVEAADFALSVAADINDRNLRDSFLQDVEPCARALSLCSQWADRGKSHLS